MAKLSFRIDTNEFIPYWEYALKSLSTLPRIYGKPLPNDFPTNAVWSSFNRPKNGSGFITSTINTSQDLYLCSMQNHLSNLLKQYYPFLFFDKYKIKLCYTTDNIDLHIDEGATEAKINIGLFNTSSSSINARNINNLRLMEGDSYLLDTKTPHSVSTPLNSKIRGIITIPLDLDYNTLLDILHD